MSFDETVSFSLEVNVGKAEDELRRLQTVLSRSLGLVQRLSGDEDLNSLITLTQRSIALANQARLAWLAFQAARLAAGDPTAWGLAIVGIGAAFVSTVDLATDLT